MKLKSSNVPIFILFTATCLAQAWGAEASLPGKDPAPMPRIEKISLDRIEESTVFFKAPEGTPAPAPLKTKIFDLSYIGQLTPQGGLPYFLVSGKPCSDCMDDKTIYALRPNSEKPNSFVYPGKILDPKTRALLFESRAFFGKCMNSKGDVYMVFQRERVDRKHALQSSVYIAEAGRDSLLENLMERRMPSINATLKLVRKKTCQEISGRNRLMLSKPLDLNPRNHDEDVEADDRDDEESETDKASAP
jgi:hypothetical protein